MFWAKLTSNENSCQGNGKLMKQLTSSVKLADTLAVNMF